MADRFSADKKYTSGLIKDKIPAVKMLYFGTERNTNTVIYLFAMALGIREGERTPSTAKEGVVQATSFRNQDLAMSLVYSLAIQELRRAGRENEINDEDTVFKIAEEYANTGFKIIEEMVDFDDYNEEDFENELILMMDEMYEGIMESLEADS